VIFATKELFDATVKRLEAAKAAKTWAMPKTDAGKTFSLIRHISTLIRLPTNIKQGIEHESPEFMPMEIYIQGNWPQDGEEAEEPTEPESNLAVPRSCLELAKAIEFIHH
jgi:hypothetical protein